MVPATLLDDKASNTEKFATFESLTSTERLSTVSSPFMVYQTSSQFKITCLFVFTFFSGTGKTTTLIKMCKENPHLKFLVVCYNRTVADYAKKMFPKKNVECWTAHSLAYRKVVEGQNFSKDWKLCENLKAQDIMSRYCSTGCRDFKGGGDRIRSKSTKFNFLC